MTPRAIATTTSICPACQAALGESGANHHRPTVGYLGDAVTDPALRYDEARLIKALAEISSVARAVFAAACAERMLPVYRWFHGRTGRGEPVALERALADLWVALESGCQSPESLHQHQIAVEELVPNEDDSWVDECAYAENAAAAVAYAIRAWLTGSPQEAAWAARQAYDALDYRITNRDNVDLNASGVREQIEADPLIQEELARQRRDLEVLGRTPGSSGAFEEAATQLRERARIDGKAVFDFVLE